MSNSRLFAVWFSAALAVAMVANWLGWNRYEGLQDTFARLCLGISFGMTGLALMGDMQK